MSFSPSLSLSACSNAEDVRREEEELTSSSHHVMTLDGDIMALNGKLLSTRGGTAAAAAAAAHSRLHQEVVDQVSVCSCNCLGPARHCGQHATIPMHSLMPGGAMGGLARGHDSPLDSHSGSGLGLGLASISRGEYSPLVGDPLFRRALQRKRSI